jgi:hypothetical protein
MRQANVMNSLSTVAQGPGRYIHWGVIQISVTNLSIIAAMVVLFILAVIVPFPSGHHQDRDEERQGR